MADQCRNRQGRILSRFGILAVLVLASVGCGTDMHHVKGQEMPLSYYPVTPMRVPETPGSVWSSNQGFFRDDRAHGVNDLVTIQIAESDKGTKNASTGTEKAATEDRQVTELLGLPLNFGMTDFLGLGTSFNPAIGGTTSSSQSGKGSTDRDGTLTASITAKVKEVLPNGNFVLEARKETLINNENQILVLQGIVRPNDIRSDNTVSSTYIADAKISFTGEGIIDDRQRVGWMTRILDRVWPF